MAVNLLGWCSLLLLMLCIASQPIPPFPTRIQTLLPYCGLMTNHWFRGWVTLAIMVGLRLAIAGKCRHIEWTNVFSIGSMYMVCTYLLIHHKKQPDLGKYTSPMDLMYLPNYENSCRTYFFQRCREQCLESESLPLGRVSTPYTWRITPWLVSG